MKEHALREYAIGLGLGVVFAVVTGGIAVAAGNAKLFTGTAPGMLVLFLLGYLIQGMAEELLYRSPANAAWNLERLTQCWAQELLL